MNEFNGKRILVIDDEPAVRDSYKRYFEKRGFQVAQAESGRDALEALAAFAPHIVLLDFLMPEMDGIKVLKEMKRREPGLKVVMISAVESEAIYKLCMEAGAIDYLVKPFEWCSLEARIMGKILTA